MKKEITDKNSIQRIVNNLFGSIPVYLKFFDKDVQVKVIALKKQGLLVRLPVKMEKGNRILSVIYNNHKFSGVFSVLGSDSIGHEVLSPVVFTIEEAKREINRVEFSPESKDYNRIKIENIVNFIDVNKAIGFSDKKVEVLVSTVDAKLKNKHPDSMIYLSARMDNRLRLMHNYDKSIFVSNRFDSKSVEMDYLPYEEYNKIIQLNKLPENFVSEISIMIKYKGYTPLGYIQVLSEKALTQADFESVETLAKTLSVSIVKTGVFHESSELCTVQDISLQGLSFMHPQSRFFSKSFAVGETIYFDLLVDEQKKGTLRAIIRNIKNTEKDFRVGCQFYNIRDEEFSYLEELIEEEKSRLENAG